jgi:purine-nucleoside phosphorylase
MSTAETHAAEGMQVLIEHQTLEKAVSYLSSRITQRPALALVLGSGLGDFANQLTDSTEIPSSTIPSYPSSTVEGHEGSLVFGTLASGGRKSLPILAFKGRIHFYESGDLELTTLPVRIARALGANVLIATNAAGGINRTFAEGDLMVISDFINMAYLRPKILLPKDSISLFRASESPCLDEHLSSLIATAAKSLDIPLKRGTYCYLRGPSYETKAEIEMLHRLGADAVGMSTVPEIVTAAAAGMRVAAISLISNLAAGLGGERLSHKEVAETAARVRQKFSALLTEMILRIEN